MGVMRVNHQLISFLHISSHGWRFACNSQFLRVRVEKSELSVTQIKESLVAEQIVFSSSARPSDKQAWVPTYDPFS